MPRKFVRKLIPDIASLIKRPSLRWMGSLIHDPNLLHINRHSISLGVFVGVFCAFLPLPGQTAIAALMAFWLGANLPVSVILIWISNPVTIPPLFYLTYKLGTVLLGTEAGDFEIALTWEWFSQIGTKIMLPLFTGSLLCGVVFGGLGYITIKQLWRWQVLKSWQRRHDIRLAKKEKAAAKTQQ